MQALDSMIIDKALDQILYHAHELPMGTGSSIKWDLEFGMSTNKRAIVWYNQVWLVQGSIKEVLLVFYVLHGFILQSMLRESYISHWKFI